MTKKPSAFVNVISSSNPADTTGTPPSSLSSSSSPDASNGALRIVSRNSSPTSTSEPSTTTTLNPPAPVVSSSENKSVAASSSSAASACSNAGGGGGPPPLHPQPVGGVAHHSLASATSSMPQMIPGSMTASQQQQQHHGGQSTPIIIQPAPTFNHFPFMHNQYNVIAGINSSTGQQQTIILNHCGQPVAYVSPPNFGHPALLPSSSSHSGHTTPSNVSSSSGHCASSLPRQPLVMACRPNMPSLTAHSNSPLASAPVGMQFYSPMLPAAAAYAAIPAGYPNTPFLLPTGQMIFRSPQGQLFGVQLPNNVTAAQQPQQPSQPPPPPVPAEPPNSGVSRLQPVLPKPGTNANANTGGIPAAALFGSPPQKPHSGFHGNTANAAASGGAGGTGHSANSNTISNNINSSINSIISSATKHLHNSHHQQSVVVAPPPLATAAPSSGGIAVPLPSNPPPLLSTAVISSATVNSSISAVPTSVICNNNNNASVTPSAATTATNLHIKNDPEVSSSTNEAASNGQIVVNVKTNGQSAMVGGGGRQTPSSGGGLLPSVPLTNNSSSSNCCGSNDLSDTGVVDLKNELTAAEIHAMFMQEVETMPANDRPQILTHFIDGFVIQESLEPFPLSPLIFDEFPMLIQPANASIDWSAPPRLTPEEREAPVGAADNAPPSLLTEPAVADRPASYSSSSAFCLRCERPLDAANRYEQQTNFCSKNCYKSYQRRRLNSDESVTAATASADGNSGGARRRSYGGGNGGGGTSRKRSKLDDSRHDRSSPSNASTPTKRNTDTPSELPSASNSFTLDEPSPPIVSDKNPADWTVEDVQAWLLSLGAGVAQYVSLFRQQEIDGQALLLLQEDHLVRQMGLKLGPSVKICAALKILRG